MKELLYHKRSTCKMELMVALNPRFHFENIALGSFASIDPILLYVSNFVICSAKRQPWEKRAVREAVSKCRSRKQHQITLYQAMFKTHHLNISNTPTNCNQRDKREAQSATQTPRSRHLEQTPPPKCPQTTSSIPNY